MPHLGVWVIRDGEKGPQSVLGGFRMEQVIEVGS